MEASELRALKRFFPCTDTRMKIKRGDHVVGRYSVLPFYKEQAQDVEHAGALLINSFSQHRYVADMRNWVEDLGDLTPKTWYRLEEVNSRGPFVLKGCTNSRKFDWKTHMFAKSKKDAGDVMWRLMQDALIIGEDQPIYIRKYVPLMKLMDGINGLPVSKEFRFFVCRSQVLCGAFYWSNYAEDLSRVPSVSEVPESFLEEVIDLVGDRVEFFVLDVAQKEDGDWIVIELNDGQMSGLSENDPALLYSRLRDVLVGRPETKPPSSSNPREWAIRACNNHPAYVDGFAAGKSDAALLILERALLEGMDRELAFEALLGELVKRSS